MTKGTNTSWQVSRKQAKRAKKEAKKAKAAKRSIIPWKPKELTHAIIVPWKGGAETLIEMLTSKRPWESETEKAFIKRYIDPLKPEVDGFGNRWLMVGDGVSATMFSCHTDSVHSAQGLQKLTVKSGDGCVTINDKISNCLGADDATGVWLMTEMAKAGVPGLYLFHRGEEHGCKGSSWIAKNHAHDLAGVNRAIAFDRKGFGNVITHQMGKRGCSAAFADALSLGLGGQYKPDDTGMYTDTAFYDDLIPETTNLSVGYFDQHTKHECQYLGFAVELLAKCIKLDWEGLPTERDPTKEEFSYGNAYAYQSQPRGHATSYQNGYGGARDYHDNYDLAYSARPVKDDEVETPGADRLITMAAIAKEYPQVAAQMLHDCAYTEDDMLDMASDMMGDEALVWYYNNGL